MTFQSARRAANLLSASRFVLGAMWLAAFVYGARRSEVLGPIALAAAVSDFARRPRRPPDAFRRSVRTMARQCGRHRFRSYRSHLRSHVGAISTYRPALIGVSFAQYAIDSIVISGSPTPVRSRLGHLGGIVNFALVLLLAFGADARWPGIVAREASPLLAIFYFAAIFERMLGYVATYRQAPSHRARSIHG